VGKSNRARHQSKATTPSKAGTDLSSRLAGSSRRRHPSVQSLDGREVNWIIETKGRVYPDVEHKDMGIRTWCHTMREQTGQDWRYCQVDQLVFDKGQHVNFDALVVAVESNREKASNLGLVIDGQ
jgi:predicted flavoprotein YhiN